MSPQTWHSKDQAIEEFFFRYDQLNELERFFARYEKLISPSGRLPTQNFLLGSSLLKERETRWCRVLRWLLDLDACAGLALEFQRILCKAAANFTLAPGESLAAKAEEGVAEDRYDVTLTSARRLIIIEAKVNASYNPDQHRRYTKRLRATNGCGIYISRERIRTAGWEACWKNVTWLDVAAQLEDCLKESEDACNSLSEQRWRVVAQDFADLVRRLESQ